MLYGRSRPVAQDVLLLIRRAWRIIALSVVIGLSAALITSVIQRPSFETSATLLLQLGRGAGGTAETDTSENARALVQAVRTEIEILNSRDLKQQVIERLGT